MYVSHYLQNSKPVYYYNVMRWERKQSGYFTCFFFWCSHVCDSIQSRRLLSHYFPLYTHASFEWKSAKNIYEYKWKTKKKKEKFHLNFQIFFCFCFFLFVILLCDFVSHIRPFAVCKAIISEDGNQRNEMKRTNKTKSIETKANTHSTECYF